MAFGGRRAGLPDELSGGQRWNGSAFSMLFLTGFVLYFAASFAQTTMFELMASDDAISGLKWVGVILCVLAGLASLPLLRPAQVSGVLVCAAVLLGSFVGSGSTRPLYAAVMLFGASRVSLERLMRWYLRASVVLTVITVASAAAGVIDNLTIPRPGGYAYAWGFSYSNELSARITYILLTYMWLERRRLSLARHCIILFWSLLAFAVTDSRLGLVILLAAQASVAMWVRGSRRGPEPYRAVMRALPLSAPVWAAVSLILMVTFSSSNSFMRLLDNMMSGRLALANEGYRLYGVTLLGQSVELRGWGFGRVLWFEDYFYLDNSYVNILLRFGALTLAVAVVAMWAGARRAWRASDGVLVIVLSAVATASMVNEHLLDLAYNVFLLVPVMSLAPSVRLAAQRDSPARYRLDGHHLEGPSSLVAVPGGQSVHLRGN